MSKQGISKGASMHQYASIRGQPNTITDELSRQWNLDMANRLQNLMRIDPIEGPDLANEPFDADNYLAWLYQYAQLKLEQGVVVKHLRGNARNTLVEDRARAFSQITPRDDPIQRRTTEADKSSSSSDKKRADFSKNRSDLKILALHLCAWPRFYSDCRDLNKKIEQRAAQQVVNTPRSIICCSF